MGHDGIRHDLADACIGHCRQTPLPFIFAVHLKQCVSIYLFVLPFTLVDIMGWRMVPLVAVVACRLDTGQHKGSSAETSRSVTLMGVEGIASEVEQPFGEWVPAAHGLF